VSILVRGEIYFSLKSATPGRTLAGSFIDGHLNGQVENTYLSFQQLEASTPTCAHVAEFIFRAVLCDNRCRVSSSNDDHSALRSCFDVGIEESLRSTGESRELEYTRWTAFPQ
jgi:hypothetical protein